ncbi:hypothetical protein BDA99DRAFT_538996 [Phascolomyces articulosus]|uniref:C2H2-type domain-containing protein n=1 Tax=Phascolomyces articulosus TaxID=60185 RepID=A0AAD5K6M3_9FUNG|nr:hypothetical protein BDA99DRAFT_538996 [Phascolomyces articulosus]
MRLYEYQYYNKPDDVNYYCPYENCQYQAQQSFNALPNHIRKYHFKDLPAEILIKDYVLETMSGDIINIEDPECRNTVEANQEILIRYKDPAQDRRTNLQLRCPYKNCTTKYSNRSAVYVHLRAAHSVPIPHLSRGGQNKYICRESSGKVLSFGVGQDELLDLENEISVEVISRTRWSIRNK